jgi:D-threo-aldose 1-dehydrogenase
LLHLCREKNIGVILGGIFNSGLLANPEKNKTFDYVDASSEIVQKAQELSELAQSYGVSLAHAAVQFGLRHTGVSSIVIGARTSIEIDQDLSYASEIIPDAFWDALQTLR